MSYNSTSWLKKRSLFRSLFAAAGYVSLCAQSTVAVGAEQEWWFDVEVIVFKRNVGLGDISEKFPLAPPSLPAADNVDLLTPYLSPDLSYLLQNLTVCYKPITPQNYWGFAPLLAGQSLDASLSDENGTQTNSLTNPGDSGITATQVNIDDEAPQAVSQVDRDEPYPQDPLVIDLNTEATQAQTETSKEIALFTADDILASFVNIQLPAQFPCAYPEQVSLLTKPFDEVSKDSRVSKISRVPINIDGIEWNGNNTPYLLPQSFLTLSELFADINQQQDLLPLLHLGWRQEVLFGQDQAKAFRLFAGENFADIYAASGEILVEEFPPAEDDVENYIPIDEISDGIPIDLEMKIPDEDNLFARINKVLADDSPIIIDEQTDNNPVDLAVQQALSALWELDGKLKVYLQNVGRTPYLHIDTNLEYRSPIFVASKQIKQEDNNQSSIVVGEKITQANYLQSVQFDQLRRVISKQLHYFDHPLFGMIVHITRYERPEPEPEPESPTLLESQPNPANK